MSLDNIELQTLLLNHIDNSAKDNLFIRESLKELTTTSSYNKEALVEIKKTIKEDREIINELKKDYDQTRGAVTFIKWVLGITGISYIINLINHPS